MRIYRILLHLIKLLGDDIAPWILLTVHRMLLQGGEKFREGDHGGHCAQTFPGLHLIGATHGADLHPLQVSHGLNFLHIVGQQAVTVVHIAEAVETIVAETSCQFATQIAFKKAVGILFGRKQEGQVKDRLIGIELGIVCTGYQSHTDGSHLNALYAANIVGHGTVGIHIQFHAAVALFLQKVGHVINGLVAGGII